MPHVSIYLDDILVTGISEADHLKTLDEVLNRLETAGLRLKRNKCAFLLPSVEYLGHKMPAKVCRLQMKTSEPLRRLQQQITCLKYVHLLD